MNKLEKNTNSSSSEVYQGKKNSSSIQGSIATQ
jgi:hypothetical protein